MILEGFRIPAPPSNKKENLCGWGEKHLKWQMIYPWCDTIPVESYHHQFSLGSSPRPRFQRTTIHSRGQKVPGLSLFKTGVTIFPSRLLSPIPPSCRYCPASRDSRDGTPRLLHEQRPPGPRPPAVKPVCGGQHSKRHECAANDPADWAGYVNTQRRKLGGRKEGAHQKPPSPNGWKFRCGCRSAPRERASFVN